MLQIEKKQDTDRLSSPQYSCQARTHTHTHKEEMSLPHGTFEGKHF